MRRVWPVKHLEIQAFWFDLFLVVERRIGYHCLLSFQGFNFGAAWHIPSPYSFQQIKISKSNSTSISSDATLSFLLFLGLLFTSMYICVMLFYTYLYFLNFFWFKSTFLLFNSPNKLISTFSCITVITFVIWVYWRGLSSLKFNPHSCNTTTEQSHLKFSVHFVRLELSYGEVSANFAWLKKNGMWLNRVRPLLIWYQMALKGGCL